MPAHFRGQGGASDVGNISGWHYDGTNVVVEGVQLNGFLPLVFYSTITVPRLYGHYSCTDASCGGSGAFMTWPPFVDPSHGFSQVQVAP